MENINLNDKKEIAKSKLTELESKFKNLSENSKLSDSEFYVMRSSIDSEISKIYDEFPDLEEWNDNQ